MEPADVSGAVAAVISIASGLDLAADSATVLHNSNKLAIRVLPCDVFARVSLPGNEHARFEIDLARRLAAAGCPVAFLEPRVEPRGYERDGFEVTFWTHYEPREPLAPGAYADAMWRLHAGMRTINLPTPHCTDRVIEAEQLVADPDPTPDLADPDRDLLLGILREFRRALGRNDAAEQLLHGEPHPSNVLNTADGARFIDLETCCRGPVEFDLAHVPATVSDQYPGHDPVLLGACRRVVLAMVAAWRFDRDDQFPNGHAFRAVLLTALRTGPPWPTLEDLVNRIAVDQDSDTSGELQRPR